MPRLRSRQVVSGVVPEVLRDPFAAVWDDVAEVLRLCQLLGLVTDFDQLQRLPDVAEYRHAFVARLWALSNGLSFTASSGRVFVDWAAMRDAGVADSYATRARARRLLDSG